MTKFCQVCRKLWKILLSETGASGVSALTQRLTTNTASEELKIGKAFDELKNEDEKGMF